MADFEIGIIGGTGGIGRWFVDFFKNEGYIVHASGRKTGLDIDELTGRCGVVIVSVPIGVTCDVIRQVGPHMKDDSLLMDFTSLKEEPVRCMLESSASEVMGCHPLFGPDVTSLEEQNIVLFPARIAKWTGWPENIFKKCGAHVFEDSPEKHDEMMAIIQGLNHLNSITMGTTLKDQGIDLSELKHYTTPLFNKKLEIIARVMENSPRLYAELLAMNPKFPRILTLYKDNLSKLETLIRARDIEGLVKFIEK